MAMTPLQKLLKNKGLTLVSKGNYGDDLYLAFAQNTGKIVLCVANEGSQFYKETVLQDSIIDLMFETCYENAPKAEINIKAEDLKNGIIKYLVEKENFIPVWVNERETKTHTKLRNESCVRILAEEQAFTIINTMYINGIFGNMDNITISFKTIVDIIEWIKKMVQEIKNELNEENKGE